jgi:hypothetical protein
MRIGYQSWLSHNGYVEATIKAQLYRVARVEEFYGSLEVLFGHDRLDGLIKALTYSTDNWKNNQPNPTLMPLSGDLRKNLASYKHAVQLYLKFLEGKQPKADGTQQHSSPTNKLEHIEVERVSNAEARTLAHFKFDGRHALESIIGSSQYGTLDQAVASLTVFTHPETVRQTDCKALFRTIRDPAKRGTSDEAQKLMYDDNSSPTDAFLWSNRLLGRGHDTQFNHVYAASKDVKAYTALPNICMTPAFLAKLTDTKRNEKIRQLIQYRSYELYGWVPDGFQPPNKPDGYELLTWADPLSEVVDLPAVLQQRLDKRKKSLTSIAARKFGWLFGPPKE